MQFRAVLKVAQVPCSLPPLRYLPQRDIPCPSLTTPHSRQTESCSLHFQLCHASCTTSRQPQQTLLKVTFDKPNEHAPPSSSYLPSAAVQARRGPVPCFLGHRAAPHRHQWPLSSNESSTRGTLSSLVQSRGASSLTGIAELVTPRAEPSRLVSSCAFFKRNAPR